MKYSKKKICLTIILTIICFIVIGIIVGIVPQKEFESVDNNVSTNVEEQDNLQDLTHKTISVYKTFEEKVEENEDIIGILKKVGEDYIEISNNPNGVYSYQDFESAILKISNQTKFQNLVTGETGDVSVLNDAEIILVNDIGKNYFYNYTLNNYEVDKNRGNILFITRKDLLVYQKQTFNEHFDEEEQKLSNLKIDSVYKELYRYNSDEKGMDCILYMNIKDKQIPYLITIYKNNETLIENPDANNYADIIIEKHGENSAKELEWLLAKKIIYK